MMRLPRFSLPRPVGILLGILMGIFAVDWLGRIVAAVSVYEILWLDPAAVFEGEVWRLFSFGFLPAGILDLLLGGIGIVWFGSRVARVWRGREFFGYCGICVLAAGVGRVLVSAGGNEVVLGLGVLTVGLLVPWARMFGYERISVFGVWETRIFSVAVVAGLAMALLPAVSGGWKQSVMLLCAAGGGWLYLSLRWKGNREISARTVDSERIGRLEL